MRYWIAIVCCLLFLKPALAQDTDTDRYDLAFRSDYCIVLFDVETNERRFLTPSIVESTPESYGHLYCDQFNPVWSHDGEQVAFTMFNGTVEYGGQLNTDLYIVDVDGKNLRNLGDQGAYAEENPVWSPDGTHILLRTNSRWGGGGGTSDFKNLFVVDVDDGGFHLLTFEPGDVDHPEWSPDGNAIIFSGPAYLQDRYKQMDFHPIGNKIYWMDMQAAEFTPESLIPLTDQETDDFNPVWSPDGSRIAYLSGQGRVIAIMVMDISAEGIATSPHQMARYPVTNNLSIDVLDYSYLWNGRKNLVWSPDGESLAVALGSPTASDIYRVDSSRNVATPLTDHVGVNSCPVWSPDSKQIAFLSERDGQTDIYLVNADGSGLRNLTNDEEPQQCPSWRP